MTDETAKAMRRVKVTVHDVARLANVSIATVSRALNTPQAVRPEVRARVEKAAETLGYHANSFGKGLRQQRGMLVGTLVPRLSDPLFSLVASGVQETLAENGYLGFLQPIGYDNRALYQPARQIIERGAEGLIVFGKIEDERLIDYCQRLNFPLLTVYSWSADAVVPSIGFDNYEAASQLVDLMLQLGHRGMAMIAGPQGGNDRQQDRIRAFRDRAGAAGIEPLVEEIDMAIELPDGKAAISRILDRHPEVTAVLCNRDALAFSAMAELRRRNISVPGQISLTGFDDLEYSALLDPPLTSVSVPAAEMGRHAATAMIQLLENGRPLQSVRFQTEVVLRRSTAPPAR